MLSQKMEAALNQQVNAELWSGYLYLSMSYDMDNKGFEGMASWFALRAKEEFAHATRLMKYLGERGSKVALMPIAEVKQEWKMPLEAFEETLQHEKKVTEKIHHLMDMAIEIKDYATQSFLKWFVDEQVEEEDAVSKIVEKMKRVQDHIAGLYFLDKALGAR